jgi:hypothetical protein
VATLRDSKQLIDIMDQIHKFTKTPRTVAEMHSSGAGEADPEYKLIVEANNIAAEIDNEIGKILLILTSLFLYILTFFRYNSPVCEGKIFKEVPRTGLSRRAAFGLYQDGQRVRK